MQRKLDADLAQLRGGSDADQRLDPQWDFLFFTIAR